MPFLLPHQSTPRYAAGYGPGTLCKVQGNINAQKYINILDNHLWPVIARHFPANNCIFQDDNGPVHRAHVVQEFYRGIYSKSLQIYPKTHNGMHSIQRTFDKVLKVSVLVCFCYTRRFQYCKRDNSHATSAIFR
jgi:hypothetical protein